MFWTPTTADLEHESIWMKKEASRIGSKQLSTLARMASRVRKNAYQPYSKYSVGAAILTKSRNMYASCNAEVVSWTETDHAERSAITQAISMGEIKKSGRRFLVAIVVSHSSRSAPCGGCRQRIGEHADNCLIIDADTKGNIKRITSLITLLPYAFLPTHLMIK